MWHCELKWNRVVPWSKWLIESEACSFELDKLPCSLFFANSSFLSVTLSNMKSVFLLSGDLDIKMTWMHFSLKSEVNLYQDLVSWVLELSVSFDVEISSFKA